LAQLVEEHGWGRREEKAGGRQAGSPWFGRGSRIANSVYSTIIASRAMKTPCVLALAWAGLGSIALGLAAGQDAAFDPRDFSKTNSVTLLLVDATRGRPLPEQGLQHIYLERDGQTAVLTVL
jgi:hypothetical protein